ncbi:MAG: aspartate aminotransferase family protein [Acidimicrobiales bacterium]
MDAPLISTPHPGPKSREIIERVRGSEARSALTFGMADDPVVLDEAHGAVITDPDGNRFLDMVAGFGSLNLGHAHPEVADAVAAQARRGTQAMSFTSEVRVALLERLVAMPVGSYRALLAASGSEAVETALKLARRATGRVGIVGFSGGFHGRTVGALALMGRKGQREGLGNLGQPVTHIPYPDPYRSPFGRDEREVAEATLALLDHQLGDPASGWDETAAVIIEPVQGNGGMIPAPPGFMSGLREVCDRHGVLLISDEVMSGFHRTGRQFAYEHDDDVRPDIIVLGKSLSAGLPLAGCLISEEVARQGPSGVETSTYAGNLVSCAAAVAALDVYDRLDMSNIAAAAGAQLIESLRGALGDHPAVGDIRGRGLMAAVELVSDRETREPLPIARRVSDATTRRGLLVYPGGHHGNVIGMLPPLIATHDQLATAADVLADVLMDLGLSV